MRPVKKKVTRKKKLTRLPLSRPVTPSDIMDRARQYGPACIDTLADVAANGNDMARISAAGSLLDRGFGKVAQGVDHTSSDGSMSPAPVALNIGFTSKGADDECPIDRVSSEI